MAAGYEIEKISGQFEGEPPVVPQPTCTGGTKEAWTQYWHDSARYYHGFRFVKKIPGSGFHGGLQTPTLPD